jgi:hypothetical protein
MLWTTFVVLLVPWALGRGHREYTGRVYSFAALDRDRSRTGTSDSGPCAD